ncbi:MAG: hypothetical protein KIS77_00400 [Saprospiraceae bacterium]|nr:hypothetical protein [Saprospiraceae bacterium]
MVLTSSAPCANPLTATSNTITMTVNATVTPSVLITVAPNDTICSGTSVTFTAIPTNGGATPSYQWKKNGLDVGTNSNTYTDAGLANGDQISVTMTSSAPCANPLTATSNTITMTVNATVTPSVSITANPGNTICSGTSVTFTAIPTNGGATPSYQWKKNGLDVGTNSNTYTDAGLANGDQISVVLTSSAPCANPLTATSNTITMTVANNVTPSVLITVAPNDTICSGTSVTFTAIPTNGGATPSYQWKKNGLDVGTNSNTYTDAGLANGDQISVVLTSSAPCANPLTATSNTITMTVNATVTPSVSITANPGNTICSGTSVTFTAIPTNGGATPSYQWKKNGLDVGTNSNTYTDAGLANGDQISVVLTSSAPCANPLTATSNTITMTVNALPNVTCPDNQSVCVDNLPLDLTTLGALPAGGTFSGNGVTGTSYSAAVGTTNTVTYIYNDGTCSVSCTFSITVESGGALMITCPTSVSITTSAGGTGDCEGQYEWNHPIPTSGCGPIVSYLVSYQNPDGTYDGPYDLYQVYSGGMFSYASRDFEVGESLVRYSVEDGSGGVAKCEFKVVVVDDEAPYFYACPGDVTVSNDPGKCGAYVSWVVPHAGDNCGVERINRVQPGTGEFFADRGQLAR